MWRQQVTSPSGALTLREQETAVVPAQVIHPEREFFIDNLLVRIHLIVAMIRWTGLAPWEFEFPIPGSLRSDFLDRRPCPGDLLFFFFTLVTGPIRSLILKLGDTRVYQPQIRARLGATAHCPSSSLLLSA